MKHAVSQELFHYWNRLRGARLAPERGDLDPAMIRGILADTFVLEVAGHAGPPNRSFPLRLSGTRVNALFLDELKQRCFLSLWDPDQRQTIADLLSCVLDDQTAIVAGVSAAPHESEALELELLLLPLRHHGNTHRRILASLAPFRIPSWLGLRAVQHLRLTSTRTMTAPALPHLGVPASLLGSTSVVPVRRGRFLVHEGGH